MRPFLIIGLLLVALFLNGCVVNFVTVRVEKDISVDSGLAVVRLEGNMNSETPIDGELDQRADGSLSDILRNLPDGMDGLGRIVGKLLGLGSL